MKKKQLFSLRKLSVGIASVSLGTIVFLGGGQTVNAETQDLNQKTQDAYNTINNLPSLTDAEKDAYNQQILEQSGQNNSNFDAILNEAQNNNTQAAQNISQASQEAYNTINNLPSLTNAQKDAYNQQILEIAGANNTNFDAILAEAQNVNTQAAQDISLASQEAYNTINNLPYLTNSQKDAYNQRILEVAGTNSTDFDAILSEAKALDAQAAKETPEALKALNTATQEAYNTINNLPHLTDEQKDDFNHQILVESGQNSTEKFDAILSEAKALDTEQSQAQEETEKQEEPESEDTVTGDDVKTEDNQSEDTATEEDIETEDNKSEDKAEPKNPAQENDKSEDNKVTINKTDNEAVEKEIAKATDEKISLKDKTKAAHSAVNQLENLSQQQKNDYIAQIDKSAKEDKGAQFEAILTEAKTEDAKVTKEMVKPKNDLKELPATGESDEVLFGLLSGALFASAGTLFLLNARRKENK